MSSDRHGSGHDGGHSLASPAPSLLHTLPLGAGAFAAAWLGVDGARRRRTWAGLARAVPAVAQDLQRVAALGLAGAGVVHLGAAVARG